MKRSDLLPVELDHLAGVGRGVVGGDHGVGLGPASVVQVRQGARHQVVSCPAGEGRHGREGGAGRDFLSIENISDLVFSRNRPILRQRPILTWYGRGEHWIGVGRGEHGK